MQKDLKSELKSEIELVENESIDAEFFEKRYFEALEKSEDFDHKFKTLSYFVSLQKLEFQGYLNEFEDLKQRYNFEYKMTEDNLEKPAALELFRSTNESNQKIIQKFSGMETIKFVMTIDAFLSQILQQV